MVKAALWRMSGNCETALTYDGYIQIGYLSQFLHGLGDDLLKLRPDQNLIAGKNSENYDTHIQAAVAKDGSLAVIYSASDERYSLNLSRLRTNHPTVRWFNPRNNAHGKRERVKAVSGRTLDVDPPGDQGPGNDWVLILGESVM
jgi:hypothetical protein